MGSIASRPKAPAQQQIVYYVPQPAPPSSSGESPNPAATPTPEQLAAESRAQNLLQRSRGIFGTVLTGFRGFLGTSQNSTRKSLLGE